MNGRLQPFLPAQCPPMPASKLVEVYGLEPDAAREEAARFARVESFLNREYQVDIDKQPKHGFTGMEVWHLSIKRRDKRHIHDWRDLQEIKNLLCGPEAEAVELYPADSRLVDAANQYHLWVFMRDGDRNLPRFPVGFTHREVDYSTNRNNNSRQRGAAVMPPKEDT